MASCNKGVLPAPCLVYGKRPIFILESMVKIVVSHRGILCTENNSWARRWSYTMPMFFFLQQMETESLWLWHSANKWKKMCQDPWHNNMSKRSVWFLHASDDLWCYFPHQMNLALIDELLNAFLKNSEANTLNVLNGGKKRFWLAAFIFFFFFFNLFSTFISQSNNCMSAAQHIETYSFVTFWRRNLVTE